MTNKEKINIKLFKINLSLTHHQKECGHYSRQLSIHQDIVQGLEADKERLEAELEKIDTDEELAEDDIDEESIMSGTASNKQFPESDSEIKSRSRFASMSESEPDHRSLGQIRNEEYIRERNENDDILNEKAEKVYREYVSEEHDDFSDSYQTGN